VEAQYLIVVLLSLQDNRGGSNDQTLVAMKVTPDYVTETLSGKNDTVLFDSLSGATVASDGTPLQPVPSHFSQTFLRHAAVKEVQTVSISMYHQYEVQTILITGATGGSYIIIVQQAVYTTALPLTASSSTIAAALNAAASKLSSSVAECYYFGVTVRKYGTTVQIDVTFQEDGTPSPLTPLMVYGSELTGTDVFYNVSTTKMHSALPTGSFTLSLPKFVGVAGSTSTQMVTTAPIPFDASASDMQKYLGALGTKYPITIQATLSSSNQYVGSTWTITFLTPRGDIPPLHLNTTHIVGLNVAGSVATGINGSDTTLFFDPIPNWCMEVPTSLVPATSSHASGFANSNVEVYVTTSGTNDVLKSVCDAADEDAPVSGFFGQIKGSEYDCAYHYASDRTPVIYASSVTDFLDNQTASVSIVGRYFLLTNASKVKVTIANHTCNITLVEDDLIVCEVAGVPHGTYFPQVYLAGIGNAYTNGTEAMITFYQEVFSITHTEGSFAGGQEIVVRGRGFRPDSNVTIRNVGTCAITFQSVSLIKCIAPAIPADVVDLGIPPPTSFPTGQPTGMPSGQPSNSPSPTGVSFMFTSSSPYLSSEPTSPPVAIVSMVFTPKVSMYSPEEWVAGHDTNIVRRFQHERKVFTLNENHGAAAARPDAMTEQASRSEIDLAWIERFQGAAVSMAFVSVQQGISTGAPTASPTTPPPSPDPTSGPTELPSASPSVVPSAMPTADPSVVPSAMPTADPSVVPTAAPTVSPSEHPSPVPTAIPSSAPTAAPSATPSAFPSVEPTARPTTEPTAVPTAPTAAPSAEPTTKPSADPTVVPTRNPTVSPSARPTQPTVKPSRRPVTDPTMAPTFEPTVETFFNRNMFEILLDGMPTQHTFQYSWEKTPLVKEIQPPFISNAISTTVIIDGEGFGNRTEDIRSVHIGESVCNVQNVTDTQLICRLPRNKTLETVLKQPVIVDVEDKGYAGDYDVVYDLPYTHRGFMVTGLGDVGYGSVYGGNVIPIYGEGFLDPNPASYTVYFVKDIVYDEYEELLIALNLPGALSFNFSCPVLAVEPTAISCTVPHFTKKTALQEIPYRVVVVLNGVSSNCMNSTANNSAICDYFPSVAFTPVISALQVLGTNSSGAVRFMLYGSLLNYGDFTKVWVGTAQCAVDERYASSLLVSCDPLIASKNAAISVLVDTLGYANTTNIYLTSALTGYGALFGNDALAFSGTAWDSNAILSSYAGSIGGGTLALLVGEGFGSSSSPAGCLTKNTLRLVLSSGSSYTVTDILACNANVILFRTPSIIAQGASTSASASNVVAKISIAVNGVYTNFTGFSFTYKTSMTPTVVVSTSSGYASTSVTYTVTDPTSSLFSSSTITSVIAAAVGTHKCASVSMTVSSNVATCVCVMPTLVSSTYYTYLNVFPLGHALVLASSKYSWPSFHSLLSVNSFGSTVKYSSVLGGTELSLTGSGFGSYTIVNICGVSCTSINGTYHNLYCRTPQVLTTTAIDEISSAAIPYDIIKPIVVGKYYSASTMSNLKNVNDSSYTTYASDSSLLQCYIGLQLPAGMRVQPYRLRFYPRLQYAPYVRNVAFEGSADGGLTWVNLGSQYRATEGWNFITASNHTHGWYTHLRYRATDKAWRSYCMIAEIQFTGSLGYSNSTCPVHVYSADKTQHSFPGYFNYTSLSHTPLLLGISPNNGTAIGGTEVTLTGSLFGPLPVLYGSAIPTVTFSGMSCKVISYDSTSITCITSPRPPSAIQGMSIQVFIPGRGNALVGDDAEFLYIDRWSALTSWLNQEPPVKGDIVWIPQGQVILLDVKTPKLVALIVSGCLYLDPSVEVAINATYIHVDGGLLQAGTFKEPYEGKATITLHGDRFKTIALPGYGAKVLAVSSLGVPGIGGGSNGIHYPSRTMGQLEIHGRKRLRTWTFLNETAYAGQNYFKMTEKVDWAPGEKLVMAGSTGNIGSFNLPNFGIDEVVVQENIDGYTIVVTEPLEYTHTAELYFIEGRWINMRSEVGLLTRNIKIQGDDQSVSQLFGVHTIAFRSGIYRMENAEITHCGQAFAFGKYCTHSHMALNMETSYTSANSIHHSFQRAVTTHMTNNWEMRDNVAYDITGHAYFVEDGAEQYNAFTGNLGILDRRSSALLLSDQKPGMFWAAVASNFYYDNVGVHSYNFGMWFEFDGESSTDKISLCPPHEPLGGFRNNSFHHNGALGMRIYPEWTPLKVPCDEDSDPAPQYLYELLAYRNGGDGLFSKRHGDIHHISPTLVENGGDGFNIVIFTATPYNWDPNVVDGLFIASLDPNNLGGGFGIFCPQREYWYVVNSTFVNFGTSGALTSCNGCLSPQTLWQGADTYRFSGLKFVNTTRRIVWSPTKKDMWWDLDGSLNGLANTMIVQYYPHNEWPECHVPDPAVYDQSLMCNPGVRIRRLGIDNVYPNQLSYTDVTVESSAGTTNDIFFLPMEIYGWVTPVVNNHTYSFTYVDAGISAYQWRLEYGRDAYLFEQMSQGHNETIEVDYTHNRWDYDPYTFSVQYGSRSYWSSNKSYVRMHNIGDTMYVNRSTERAILSTYGVQKTASKPFQVSIYAQNCPPSGCWIPPLPTLSDPLLWSKKSTWPTKIVPIKGQAVTIESNMWVVLDISTPKLGCINVYGKLTFIQQADVNITLTALCIVVYGTMEIVGPNNTAYNGTANVVIYGAVGASLPITLGNNIFPGSKVIAVVGEFNAIGQEVVYTWTSLNHSAYTGASSIVVSGTVDWVVGGIITISPTGYYNADGTLWSSSGGSIENRKIVSITHNYRTNTTALVLNQTLTHNHLCVISYGETFCGKVGYLTRSINFISKDAENPTSPSYGFGAHFHVTDLLASKNGVSRNQYSSINLYNVALWRFGKQNSDHEAVDLAYQQKAHLPSAIVNCAFINTYDFAVYSTYGNELLVAGNVVTESWGGGIYIDQHSTNFEVLGNMVVGTHQLASILKSSYPWQRPIASFVVLSGSGTVVGNFAAGSADGGFNLAQSLFTDRVSNDACRHTRGEAYTFAGNNVTVLHQGKSVWDNEAVACRSGLNLVTVTPSEAGASECGVVIGFKLWRNGHHGLISMDTEMNAIVVDTVVAENHIGISLNYRKDSTDAFSGVYNSKIIGGLSDWSPKYTNTTYCPDLGDSSWQHVCQAFTQSDPLGLLMNKCGSTLDGTGMHRVGILLPQFLNAGKTCGRSPVFSRCEPPNTVQRLCALPYESRYGVPTSMQSGEQHIHNVLFGGFTSQGYCSSYSYSQNSYAIATNPQMIDEQASIIISGAGWKANGAGLPVGTVLETIAYDDLPDDMDSTAKFGFDVFDASYASICIDHPCNGYNMLLVHDVDGTVMAQETSHGGPGQIMYNNPEYAAPYPLCVTASELGEGFIYCPNITDTGDAPFKQYHALWRDYGPQVLQPIVVTRYFESENRSFAGYGPIMEPCSEIGFYSRYPTLIAAGVKNRVRSTGTIPSSWLFRWDAPSYNDSAILEFFIEPSDAINVFYGYSEYGTFTFVKQISRQPTLDDPIGTNCRDPTARTLTVNIRGGANNFYKFVDIPYVQVTMKMEMSIANFYADNFIANMALLLGISADRIKIASVKSGSVIVNFQITPAASVAATNDEITAQVLELQAVTANFSKAIVAGTVESTLNVTISQILALEPTIPVVVDETYVPPANSTQNITQIRAAQVKSMAATSHFLFTYPTSMPTGQPSMQPSAQPSGKPTVRPSMQPSAQPSSRPSSLPSAQPSEKPSSQPTSKPSGLPSTQPSSRPSSDPTSDPTQQPSRQPTSQPTRQPTRQPSSQPSRQPTSNPTNPTGQPTSRPTHRPSSQPTSKPSRRPSTQPSARPSSRPSSQPVAHPTVMPSGQPTSHPSGAPSAMPSCRPSGQPSGEPSATPTEHPTPSPTATPSVVPTATPSAVPTASPTAYPTAVPTPYPTAVPTADPSAAPSANPTVTPTAVPTATPTSEPSASPSANPTASPSANPTAAPTADPTAVPSAIPTATPSADPSATPSASPTAAPTANPTASPTADPTAIPSADPTAAPSANPTATPSADPTAAPSANPTANPTADPTAAPSAYPTAIPTADPTSTPSANPTATPTADPTAAPSANPTAVPSANPTASPSANPTAEPTANPTATPSADPTATPSAAPTTTPTADPTPAPTANPTVTPSADPTAAPSANPTATPSAVPTAMPTANPTAAPTADPTAAPSADPTAMPSANPTATPSAAPTPAPSAEPTAAPTSTPTATPSADPTATPTADPSASPSASPTASPTADPSSTPSANPTAAPSADPTAIPSADPTAAPTTNPTTSPTAVPTATPSADPTATPSANPTATPTPDPSATPSSVPTAMPSADPTANPSANPTPTPSADPTAAPSSDPTAAPSAVPTATPTAAPTATPTADPSASPSANPTASPSANPTAAPTADPTAVPSANPSATPSADPTATPSASPTAAPTANPTASPTADPTAVPSADPTAMPSANPTATPSADPTATPSASPTAMPTANPTATPSADPTATPSANPTAMPSADPTAVPSADPSATPTAIPSSAPTAEPTATPSATPTAVPSASPTATPTAEPSPSPTAEPTATPSANPTATPSAFPTATPTAEPTAAPSANPSAAPTADPTAAPSADPTVSPSAEPTAQPSPHPTANPTADPTAAPSAHPTAAPTANPTASPTADPTAAPSANPTAAPSANPTASPSAEPTATPSAYPTATPTAAPTATPSASPTAAPTVTPTASPSAHPTASPSANPTAAPTVKPSSEPSGQPTSRPSAIPSSVPSSIPTFIPTMATRTQVTFTSTLGLAGITASQAEAGKEALATVLEDTMGSGMGITVVINSITDVVSASVVHKEVDYHVAAAASSMPVSMQQRLRLEQHGVTVQSSSVNVDFTTSFYADRVSGGASAGYNSFTANLQSAAGSGGSLASQLVASSTAFANITVLSVQSNEFTVTVVTNNPPTAEPTPTPSSRSHSEVSAQEWFQQYFYVPIIGTVCLVFLAVVLYRRLLVAKSRYDQRKLGLFPPEKGQPDLTDLSKQLQEDRVLNEEKSKFKDGLKQMITDLYATDTEDVAMGEKLVNIINTSDLLGPDDIKELVEYSRVKSLRDLHDLVNNTNYSSDSDRSDRVGNPSYQQLPTLRRMVSLEALRNHLGVRLAQTSHLAGTAVCELYDIDEGAESLSTPNKLEQGRTDSIRWDDLYRYESTKDVRNLGENELAAPYSSVSPLSSRHLAKSKSSSNDENKDDVVLGALSGSVSSPSSTKSGRVPQPSSSPPIGMVTSPSIAKFNRPKQITANDEPVITGFSRKATAKLDDMFDDGPLPRTNVLGVNPMKATSRSVDAAGMGEDSGRRDWRRDDKAGTALLSESLDSQQLATRKHTPPNKVHREYDYKRTYVSPTDMSGAEASAEGEFVVVPAMPRIRQAGGDVQRTFTRAPRTRDGEQEDDGAADGDVVARLNSRSDTGTGDDSTDGKMSQRRLETRLLAHKLKKKREEAEAAAAAAGESGGMATKVNRNMHADDKESPDGTPQAAAGASKRASGRPRTQQNRNSRSRNRKHREQGQGQAQQGDSPGETGAWMSASSKQRLSKSSEDAEEGKYGTGHNILMPASIDMEDTANFEDDFDDFLDDYDDDDEEDIEYEDYYGERWERTDYVHGTRRVGNGGGDEDDDYDKPLQQMQQQKQQMQMRRLESGEGNLNLDDDLDSIDNNYDAGSVDNNSPGRPADVLIRRSRIAKQTSQTINNTSPSPALPAITESASASSAADTAKAPVSAAYVRHPTATVKMDAAYAVAMTSAREQQSATSTSPTSSRKQSMAQSSAQEVNPMVGSPSSKFQQPRQQPAAAYPNLTQLPSRPAPMAPQSSFTRKQTVKMDEVYSQETGASLQGASAQAAASPPQQQSLPMPQQFSEDNPLRRNNKNKKYETDTL
jgi:hypothetical protein